MKFKYMKHLDVTPIEVIATDGMSEGGAPISSVIFTGKCRLTESTETFADGDGRGRRYITIATMEGDIAPSLPNIEGYAIIGGVQRSIKKSLKPLNPDGTVCFTKLELI